MIADPDNCHLFYKCDVHPVALSCGDMMFNTVKQVCDWPHLVVQTRPECRDIEQLVSNSLEYPSERTMRMLSFYGDSSFETENTDAEQDLQMRIFLEIQRRLPELLNRKITNYVTSLNTVSQESYNLIPQSTATSRPTTPTSTSRPTTTARTTTPRARLSQATPREFFTYRSDAVPSTISFKRPRPTNFDNLHKSLSSSYSYRHNYDQQVGGPLYSTNFVVTSEKPFIQTTTIRSNSNNPFDDDFDVDNSTEEVTATAAPSTTTTGVREVSTRIRRPPPPAHFFVSDENNERRFNVARPRPNRPLIKSCRGSQREDGRCGRPRRLILRKVRRKLILNEREKLQQRRQELRNDLNLIDRENEKETVAVVARVDPIERNEDRKDQAYEEAIEKLKSLVREKQSNNEYENIRRPSSKSVSVSYSTSSSSS